MEAGTSAFVLRNVFIKNMGSILKKNPRKKPASVSHFTKVREQKLGSLKTVSKFSPLINTKEKRESVSKWKENIATFSS